MSTETFSTAELRKRYAQELRDSVKPGAKARRPNGKGAREVRKMLQLRGETVDPAAWAPYCVTCGQLTGHLYEQDNGETVRRCRYCEESQS